MDTTDKLKFYSIKIITALAFTMFAYRALVQILASDTLQPNLVLLLISESITVALILAARPAKDYAANAIALLSTFVVTFYFLVINISSGQTLLPAFITITLQIVGMLLQITAKLYLGRSFGLVAANRGVVTSGPYKFVRHPIYFGYLIVHVGFLLSLFSVQNLLIFTCLYFFQGCRIWQEEKLLLRDEAYKSYATHTKFRLIPGLF